MDPKFTPEFKKNEPFSPDGFKQAAADLETEVKASGWSMELNARESVVETSFVYDVKDEKDVKIGQITVENDASIGIEGAKIIFEEKGQESSHLVAAIRDKTRIRSLAANTLGRWKLKRSKEN